MAKFDVEQDMAFRNSPEEAQEPISVQAEWELGQHEPGFNHTPGPWEAFGTKVRRRLDGGLTEIIADVRGGSFGEAHGQGHANARLMAAAPTILNALISMLPYAEAENQSLWETARKHGDRDLEEEARRCEFVIEYAKGAIELVRSA